MYNTSPRLDLPYLMPSQAQKHVTVNEALQRLDAVVHLSLKTTDATAPPASPAAGDVHALGSDPTGDWSGQGGALALWDGTGWQIIRPAEGWMAFDVTTARLVRYDGAVWLPHVDVFANLTGVGIGTGFDAVNRLSVAASASLFTHDGTDHRVTINKAGAGDTASVVFQSGWTGHAEMGLTGGTAFSIKASADGAQWIEPLRLDPAQGQVQFAPAGPVRATLMDDQFALMVPVTGDAVQQGPTDATAGRMMAVGAFGLGAEDQADVLVSDANAPLPSGFYGGGANPTGFPSPACAVHPFVTLNRGDGTGGWATVRMFFDSGGTPVLRTSGDGGVTWGADTTLYGTSNLLGGVAFEGPHPAGAVIERGTGAQGDYVRFADGTQICTLRQSVSMTTVAAGAVHVDDASSGAWSFAKPFASPPVVATQADGTRIWANAQGCTASATVGVSLFSTQAETATVIKVTQVATGRWA